MQSHLVSLSPGERFLWRLATSADILLVSPRPRPCPAPCSGHPGSSSSSASSCDLFSSGMVRPVRGRCRDGLQDLGRTVHTGKVRNMLSTGRGGPSSCGGWPRCRPPRVWGTPPRCPRCPSEPAAAGVCKARGEETKAKVSNKIAKDSYQLAKDSYTN